MEEGEPQGTIVRVASNAGVGKGTLEMLRAIIDKLNIIASGVTDRIEREADILLSIIRLDKLRIRQLLSDLGDCQKNSKICLSGIESRIIESSSTASQPCIEQFLEWLGDISTIGPDATSEVFMRYIREAQDARRDYSSILQAASATQTGTLPHWVSLILKLGRYGVASRAMVQLALEFPSLFNPMIVEAVSPPPKVPFIADGTALNSVLRRVVAGREIEYSSRLARIWGSGDPESKFKTACPTRLTVHAEAQLACFYDHHPERNPFRFIGVSKKTCYLCFKFLALHPGSFNVSSSHQKLYVSWTLPPTDNRETRARYKSISIGICQVMEHAARKELEQRLGATHRPVPADSSAGVSLSGLTEHSGVAAPERSMTLKRKASATKCTLADKAGPYQSSVSFTQCSADAKSSQQSTAITKPSTLNGLSASGPFSNIVILFTRAGDATRQEIIRMSDIAGQSAEFPSWAKLVDILNAGGKFGLGFRDGLEYMVIDGLINMHNERQFLACLQYLRNINKLNAEAVVYSAETYGLASSDPESAH
ncbi:hypothetical protein V500_01724 [Pseudogymnoascus sp. VKM F-4518 (FW-2643)]|nr:hypothetical protein V500_01724 [Pseudogymnoascus sp. VKM F-4518 (FW-2643)]